MARAAGFDPASCSRSNRDGGAEDRLLIKNKKRKNTLLIPLDTQYSVSFGFEIRAEIFGKIRGLLVEPRLYSLDIIFKYMDLL